MDKGSEYYRRYLEGDEQGMELLIKEYSAGLTLYLDTFVHNIHTAEELMIDTFVRIGIKKPRETGKYSFRTWLYTIGKNIAIDHLRKHRLEQVSIEELEEQLADTKEIEDRILKDEQKRVLYACMKRLKEEHGRVLWLFYFEGMSTKETAKAIGRTTHATENLLSRARKSLREELIKEGFTYEDL